QGHFAEAASLLREAYGIYPAPVLLYNLGRALEGDGHLADAVAAYEAYLRAAGDVADRGAIEQRVTTLREQLERQRSLERLERQRKRPSETRSTSPGPGPWIVTGVGTAVLAVGV